MLTEGTLGGDIVQALEMAGLEEGSFERFQALSFIQWIADPVDPFGFAPFTTEDPLDDLSFEEGMGFSEGDELKANEVLLQMATDPTEGDDLTVPNATTQLVADAGGYTIDETNTFPASHGFFFELDPMADEFEAADCARRQAVAYVANGLAGTAEFPDALKASTCVMGN